MRQQKEPQGHRQDRQKHHGDQRTLRDSLSQRFNPRPPGDGERRQCQRQDSSRKSMAPNPSGLCSGRKEWNRLDKGVL